MIFQPGRDKDRPGYISPFPGGQTDTSGKPFSNCCNDMTRHFVEKVIITATGWIPAILGMGIRLVLWRPLFATCGKVRFGSWLVVQDCRNMRLADGVRIGRGCHLYAENGTLEMGQDTALSPGVTVDACNGCAFFLS